MHAEELESASPASSGHRRRASLQSLGAAVAVAVIASGGVVLAGQDSGGGPPVQPPTRLPSPTPAPGEGVLQRIPATFPLELGMQGGLVEEPANDLRFVEELQECGADRSAPDVPTDRLTVAAASEGWTEARELSLYPGVANAALITRDLVAAFEACPQHVIGGGTATVRNVVQEVPAMDGLGDRAWTVVRTSEAEGAAAPAQAVVTVVRVGTALLVAEATSTGASGAATVTATAQRDALRPVVGAMCLFNTGGCNADGSAAVLGPEGLGPLRLGMPLAQVAAVVGRPVASCQSFEATVDGVEVRGYASTDRGLVHLIVAAAHTPEGISATSSEADVRATYDAVRPNESRTALLAAVPDWPGTSYSFGFAPTGELVQLGLVRDDQDCFG